MRKYYLLTMIFLAAISYGKEISPKKSAINPAIGVQLIVANVTPTDVQFIISIKNIGEEALSNIYITSDTGVMYFGGPIPVLAPGEEDFSTFMGYKSVMCFDANQITVHATTLASVEITDLSSPYDYYNDEMTISFNDDFLIGSQDGVYADLNGNSIVDVGDAITYIYEVNSPYDVFIVDNNATVLNPNGSGNFTTTGIHYLTTADITEGYVYNSTSLNVSGSCTGTGALYDPTPCNGCPVPSTCTNCIVTPLTSDLPNSISGTVMYNAFNDNCVTGLAFGNRKVATTNGTNTYASYSNGSGNYSILIPTTGNFSTEALSNLGANFSSNPASVPVTSSGTNIDYANTNFCISSATNYADLYVVLIPLDQPRPGFTANYKLYYRNFGSTSLNGTIELTFDNGKMVYNSSTPAVNSTALNTAIWNYSNLLPFESRVITLSLNVLPPPGAVVGDTVDFTLVGNPIVGDANPNDNTYTMQQTVMSSFDPNDKTVIEGAYIGQSQVDNYLHYVTRFQNTGTAAATTVVIKEMLDPELDWDTFEPLDASHAYSIQVLNGNDVTYTFSNIGLPDSTTDEPGSHGWMAYRIKPKNTLALNEVMSSHSDIYFDFNAPVITNTVDTQLILLSTNDFSARNLKIYPNPAANFITIESSNLNGYQFQISDINGKMLLNGNGNDGGQIDVSALQNGFYFITVSGEAGKAVQKFIKN